MYTQAHRMCQNYSSFFSRNTECGVRKTGIKISLEQMAKPGILRPDGLDLRDFLLSLHQEKQILFIKFVKKKKIGRKKIFGIKLQYFRRNYIIKLKFKKKIKVSCISATQRAEQRKALTALGSMERFAILTLWKCQ